MDIRQGPDGQTYFSARLDGQFKHHIEASTDTSMIPAERLGSDDSGPFLWVSDIVMRASTPGEAPHHGMQRFPVDLASVLDFSYLDDQTVEFAKLLPVAAVDIDDLPEDATEAAADQGRGPRAALTQADRAVATIEDLGEDSFTEPGGDDLPEGSGQTTASTAGAAQPLPTRDPLAADHPAGEPDRWAPPLDLPSVGDDRTDAHLSAVGREGESDPEGAAPAPASVPNPSSTAADPTGTPQLVLTPAPAATAAACNVGDVDATTRTETLPAHPTSSSPTVASGPPPAITPDSSETTGPIPTATTARPPASIGVGADIANRGARRLVPPQRPPERDYSLAAATAAPAPSPARHTEASAYPSSWPPAGRPGRPAAAPQMPPQHTTWPPIIPTTANRRAPSTKTIVISAVIFIGIILTAIAVWNVAASDSDGQTAAPAPSRPSDADIQRVKSAVPKGYSGDSCTARDDSAEASVKCGPNTDPGGPQTATYTLYADDRALNQAFATTIAGFNRVTCPGNIQSPGAWRRNAAPNKVAGTLFCGTREGRAAVVWTSDAQSLLNVTEAGEQGPTLDQLYVWWSTHS